MGSTDPNTPIANGWLRASHRRARPEEEQALAAVSSARPRRAAHARRGLRVRRRDRARAASSCRAGWRVALTVRGKDYEYEGELSEFAKKFHYGTRGTGGMTHNDPDTRPPAIFGDQRDAARRRRAPGVADAAGDLN